MEVIRGWCHHAFPVTDASRVGEARRFAAKAIEPWGWPEADAGRLSLVVTELGTNLMRHAVDGALWIAVKDGLQEVEVLALDRGLGIADLPRAMQDGHSTGTGSPGTGLGALRRLADDFDLASSPEGTVCMARVRLPSARTPRRPAARLGAVSLCAPGETVCGDGWAAALDEGRLSLLVADGLGHGPLAAVAACAAVDVFLEQPFARPDALLPQLHAALRTTRGAAVFAAHLTAPGSMCWTGAGNVLGRLVSGTADNTLTTPHGTAGLQMRLKAESSVQPLPAHAVAVVCTDGVATRWRSEDFAALLPRDPALLAASIAWRHGRGRDDATVLVLQPGEAFD